MKLKHVLAGSVLLLPVVIGCEVENDNTPLENIREDMADVETSLDRVRSQSDTLAAGIEEMTMKMRQLSTAHLALLKDQVEMLRAQIADQPDERQANVQALAAEFDEQVRTASERLEGFSTSLQIGDDEAEDLLEAIRECHETYEKISQAVQPETDRSRPSE